MASSRLEQLRSVIAANGADGALITNGFNRHYLSGFMSSAGSLLVTGSAAVLATDSRYSERAAAVAEGWDVRDVTSKPDWLGECAAELGIKKLCFESGDVSVARHQQMAKKAGGVELIPVSDLAEQIRVAKDAAEITKLERAVLIGDEAFTKTARGIKPGQTESEIAFQFEFNARKLGASALSFPTIVASGPNASSPHHETADRAVREGETIVFDCGVIYDSYCSDLTRTVVLGEPTDKIREVYNVVLAAQQRATAAIKPGVRGVDVDAVARDHIREAGYGKYFGHGLGHGVGLEIHEEPYLAPRSKATLAVGNVVTIEPGIYIPGWGGVRIEDMAVVEADGARVISTAEKLAL